MDRGEGVSYLAFGLFVEEDGLIVLCMAEGFAEKRRRSDANK